MNYNNCIKKIVRELFFVVMMIIEKKGNGDDCFSNNDIINYSNTLRVRTCKQVCIHIHIVCALRNRSKKQQLARFCFKSVKK